ncbi:MAG: hypothetical protein R3D29_12420 [Nitratireductor sp.]
MICTWILRLFAVLYLIALAVWAIGTFGWFGVEPDALSAVYVILLGQPWTRVVDLFPEAAWPFLTALTPAVNLGLIFALCRWRS